MRSRFAPTLAIILLSTTPHAALAVVDPMLDSGPLTTTDTTVTTTTAPNRFNTNFSPAETDSTKPVVVESTTTTTVTTTDAPKMPENPSAVLANRAVDESATGDYTLDTDHASIIFTISHLGFSHYTGRFNNIAAELHFDAVDVTKSTLTATVLPASVDTHNSSLEAELASKDWFNTAAFPQAVFTTTSIEKTSLNTARINGTLTLMGVTKPVTLDTVFNGAGSDSFHQKSKIGFSAKTVIKRSDFGLSNYIPMVGDAVALDIEVEFFRKD